MKKPREKKPKRSRRRRARIKKRSGPMQLWLPLQMPLALGAVSFVAAPTNGHALSDVDVDAEDAVVDANVADAVDVTRQGALF